MNRTNSVFFIIYKYSVRFNNLLIDTMNKKIKLTQSINFKSKMFLNT